MTKTVVLFLLFAAGIASAQVGDTVHSHRIKGISGFGEFFGFDKDNHNNILIKSQATRYLMIPVDSEMVCYVANHDKEQLRIKYDIWEFAESGDTHRWYRLISMESEKGELSWEWAAKERNDSTLLARHHKKLKEVMQWSTGSH